MEVLIIILLLVGLGFSVLAFFRASKIDPQSAINTAILAVQQSLQERLGSVQQGLQSQISSLDQRVSQSLDTVHKTVSDSLSNTSQTIKNVGEQLGQLDAATKRMVEIGRDISSLQEILSPPKLRGELGEFLLENLLRQVLPKAHFQTQYPFRNGNTVDAIIRIGDGIVPVDSKFPLDSFSQMIAAATDQERQQARRSFIRDVKEHVDRVAQYIQPDEGTYNFALMYIPAENVYYEAILRRGGDADREDLTAYAYQHRVFPVSPNIFYAYLQVIVLGLKGLRVEAQARQIIAHLNRLEGEFGGFKREFDTLGTHIRHAHNKYSDVSRQVDSLQNRLAQPVEPEPLSLPSASEGSHLGNGHAD